MRTQTQSFRIEPELLAQIDAWRERHPLKPTRTQVVKLSLDRLFAETEEVAHVPHKGTVR